MKEINSIDKYEENYYNQNEGNDDNSQKKFFITAADQEK